MTKRTPVEPINPAPGMPLCAGEEESAKGNEHVNSYVNDAAQQPRLGQSHSPRFDCAAVEKHVTILHERAAASGVDGKLVLFGAGEDPTTGQKVKARVEHFQIGDVNGMTDAVMAWENTPHLNVYASWTVVRKDLPLSSKGSEEDVVAVLAFVADQDSDTGMRGELPLDPPYGIESSRGNFQAVYPLARALPLAEAKPLAEDLADAARCDHGTKDVSHVWRVAGTLNWPNRTKVARGRPLEPQPVTVATAWTGELIEPDELRAAVAGHAKANSPGAATAEAEDSGASAADLLAECSEELQGLIVKPAKSGEDRSKTACKVIHKLVAKGKSDAEIKRLIEAHPNGIGARYADGKALAADIRRLREKHRADKMPWGYSMRSRGLFWKDPSDNEKPEVWLSGPFTVFAETRDADGASWGVLLEWLDHDGRRHRFALPRAMLAGDGADARRILLDGGLYVAPGRQAREKLTAFLVSVPSEGRCTATARVGWHGSAFVLPDRSLGAQEGEQLLLQGTGAIEHAFRQKGTLQDWQDNVARYAIGNSRMALALSSAFAAALIGPCDAESGGVNLVGPSSIGKTTALIVAGSAWGGGEPGGYVRSWRATSNGLEGVALGHCDALLCLDEMSQVDGREAGAIAYMLANGSGKSRGARDGSARRAARWRLLFLSSGEIGLADKISEDGRRRRPAAGQQVRIVDLLADAGAGLGLFEELHGFASADALARHLRQAAASCYGTAAPAFVERIAGEIADVRQAVLEHLNDFVAAHVPPGADGQVLRVAQRFGLIGAAGEIAVEAGVLPWPEGEAVRAAARCLKDWLAARGGVEPAEVRDGIAQVRSFLSAHGMSRFVPAWATDPDEKKFPVRDVAGFRKREGEGWDFYVTTSAWTEEVCKGFNPKQLAAALEERGYLKVPKSGSHRAVALRVPEHGQLRLYHVAAAILEGSDHD